jgi:RNA polymerase sigma-70 factor (ECF subfamily)
VTIPLSTKHSPFPLAQVPDSKPAAMPDSPERSQPPAQSSVPSEPISSTDEESRKQDDELVSRTQSGDAGAFDELIVKYSPRLYGLVYNMTSNHDDTHDMLQDIWSKAFRSIATFRGKSAFYTWIHSIAVNMTINFLKKRTRRTHMSLDDVDAGIHHDKDFVELAASSTPVREANLNELQKRLNEAMQRLSHDHRTVVTMFDIQGMPHAEIAKILGISEGTVRSRLFYAHRQLQNFLSEFLS